VEGFPRRARKTLRPQALSQSFAGAHAEEDSGRQSKSVVFGPWLDGALKRR